MRSVSTQDLETIRALAARMSRIKPRDADETALLAFIAGTLYSLAQAALLRFDDSRMTPDPLLAADEVRAALLAVANAESPPSHGSRASMSIPQ